MSLAAQIQSDLTASMKARDAERTSTLRMLVADLKNLRIAKGAEPADDEVVQSIRSAIKRRYDAAEQFGKGGRAELADKERAEAKILEAYLPAQLGEAELEEIVAKAISDTGATSKKDMGKVMKAVMALVGPRADGKTVNQLVGKRLP